MSIERSEHTSVDLPVQSAIKEVVKWIRFILERGYLMGWVYAAILIGMLLLLGISLETYRLTRNNEERIAELEKRMKARNR